jgi:hypothetical protein
MDQTGAHLVILVIEHQPLDELVLKAVRLFFEIAAFNIVARFVIALGHSLGHELAQAGGCDSPEFRHIDEGQQALCEPPEPYLNPFLFEVNYVSLF